MLVFTSDAHAAGSVVIPTTGTVTQPFLSTSVPDTNGGNYLDQNDQLNNTRKKFHSGVDISAGTNTDCTKRLYPVYAAEAGTIMSAKYLTGFGWSVIVDHKMIASSNNKYVFTLYGHLGTPDIHGKPGTSCLQVSEGALVTKGQLIGYQGSSGNSTGTHLHWTVKANSQADVWSDTNTTLASPDYYTCIPLTVPLTPNPSPTQTVTFGQNLCIIPHSWSSTANMTTARNGAHSATLQNGKVLVIGGSDGTNNLATAEIFDPNANGGAGSWTPTASLSEPNYGMGIAVLPGGKVLAAGGHATGSNNYLSSAEIFDPNGNGGAGSWTPTASLSAARYGPVLASLSNGRVLASGGWNSYYGGSMVIAEIFDPSANGGAGGWTLTGSMNNGRAWHTATLLLNGEVLVVGGQSTGQAPWTAELFNPAGNSGIGSWSFTSSFGNNLRVYNHTETLLLNGTVLVTGFYTDTYSSIVEFFNPSSNTWTPTTSMSTARSSSTANLLQSGRVLVAGGYNGPSLNSAEIYNP